MPPAAHAWVHFTLHIELRRGGRSVLVYVTELA
jgi:hypothetical protein